MISVLVADDQQLIRSALVALIQLEADLTVVAQAGSGEDAVDAALRTRPDVAVLDIDMPGIDGIEAATRIGGDLPDTGVLILTGLGQHGHLIRALHAQVGGYLRKNAPAEELTDGIRRVARGQRFFDPALVAAALAIGVNPLTPRETEVLRAAADGGTTDDIAATLFLSPATVRNYLSSTISKLAARNRMDALRIAREAGWL